MVLELILNEYRQGILENQYYGNICVIQNEKIIFSIGNAFEMTSLRSTEKAVHVIPIIINNIDKEYGLTDDEIAILMSSHVASKKNINSIVSLLSKSNINLDDIKCAESLPVNFFTMSMDILKKKKLKHKEYNMCIGNHASNILLCRYFDVCEHEYWNIDHRVNKIIIKFIKELSNTNDIKSSYDHCGMPCYFLPLYNLSLLYLNLNPNIYLKNSTSIALNKINKVFHKFSEYIDGEGTLSEILLRDENIICKAGSHGVFCFSLKKEQISVAIKMNGSHNEQVACVVYELLKKINYDNEELFSSIERLITNNDEVPHGINIISRRVLI